MLSWMAKSGIGISTLIPVVAFVISVTAFPVKFSAIIPVLIRAKLFFTNSVGSGIGNDTAVLIVSGQIKCNSNRSVLNHFFGFREIANPDFLAVSGAGATIIRFGTSSSVLSRFVIRFMLLLSPLSNSNPWSTPSWTLSTFLSTLSTLLLIIIILVIMASIFCVILISFSCSILCVSSCFTSFAFFAFSYSSLNSSALFF
mmetsp:Transcript_25759/g.48478  ORF Transcript_25759/g.48478 Transcript_25759/m.48478 type:complete len:200 (-) Transcript_25759:1343-1942(-)